MQRLLHRWQCNPHKLQRVMLHTRSKINGQVTFFPAKRLANEFSLIYQKYGNGFSEWWDAKNQGKKKDLLMDVTYSSIPLEELSEGEISRLLGQPNPVMSRALYDYNVQSLCGAQGVDIAIVRVSLKQRNCALPAKYPGFVAGDV